MTVLNSKITLRVENVGVEPNVGVGESVTACTSVNEDLEGSCCLTSRLGHHGETPRRHSFPAGIAKLTSSSKRVTKKDGGAGWVAPRQLHLAPQRLRPWQDRKPMVALGKLDRSVEVLTSSLRG